MIISVKTLAKEWFGPHKGSLKIQNPVFRLPLCGGFGCLWESAVCFADDNPQAAVGTVFQVGTQAV